jgi:methylenetetrahydrofolate reductase (NADPH)
MLILLSLRATRSHTLTGMAHGTSSTMPQAEHLTRSIPRMLQQEGTSYSFEFFPPKDDAGEEALWDAIRHLERVRPTFVSVTYGAGGSTRDRTVRITSRIADETTLTPMAHLTCVGSSVAELRQVVGEYAGAGIHNVLALRGDPPGGPGAIWTPHPEGLNHADELVALVRSLGNFTVGVRPSPTGTPSPRAWTRTPTCWFARPMPGPGSRSPSSSSTPTAMCGFVTGWLPVAATCRSSRA